MRLEQLGRRSADQPGLEFGGLSHPISKVADDHTSSRITLLILALAMAFRSHCSECRPPHALPLTCATRASTITPCARGARERGPVPSDAAAR